MFHPAELERRDQQEIELSERIWDSGIALEPFNRRGVEVENHVAVARHLGRVRLAMQHRELAPRTLRPLDLESPGRKSEQVGRDRLRAGKTDRGCAAVRHA